MKGYFIRMFYGIISRLRGSRVHFRKSTVEGVAGVIVQTSDIDLALNALGATIESAQDTSLDGVTSLGLLLESGDKLLVHTEMVPSYQVETSGWQGRENKKFLAIVGEILLPVVKKNIIFSMPHREVHELVYDDKFHIFIWSTPQQKKDRMTPPREMWGIHVDCRESGYRPSELGFSIVDEKTGWSVGELVDNNLYVHHDICEYGSERELQIFRRFCMEAAKAIVFFASEEGKMQRREFFRNNYTKHRMSGLDRIIEELEKKKKKGHEQIRNLQRQLFTMIQETRKAELEYKMYTMPLHEKSGLEVQYGEEYQALFGIAGVENIVTLENVINVFTDHIYIMPDEFPDKIFDIGKFKMVIRLESGSEWRIRFFNLTRKSSDGNGYNHPHVDGAGDPCLGNIKEMFPELLAKQEYSALIQLCLQYLHSANFSASGRRIFDTWPLKKEEGR